MKPAGLTALAACLAIASPPIAVADWLGNNGWHTDCEEPPGYAKGTMRWQYFNGKSISRLLTTPTGDQYPCKEEEAATNHKIVAGSTNWYTTECGPLTIAREVRYDPCERPGLTGVDAKVNEDHCRLRPGPSKRTARYELWDQNQQTFSLTRPKYETSYTCSSEERILTIHNQFTVLGTDPPLVFDFVFTAVTEKAVKAVSPPDPTQDSGTIQHEHLPTE